MPQVSIRSRPCLGWKNLLALCLRWGRAIRKSQGEISVLPDSFIFLRRYLFSSHRHLIGRNSTREVPGLWWTAGAASHVTRPRIPVSFDGVLLCHIFLLICMECDTGCASNFSGNCNRLISRWVRFFGDVDSFFGYI